MQAKETHPLLLAFGKTYEHTFPLILVIGREPNETTSSDKSLGSYDFREFPRCAFWNTAFHVFGKFNARKTSALKLEFIRKEASPIVFTDALAFGIKNQVADKNSLRKGMKEEDFNQQAEDIFSHLEVIGRTKLILLSGLSDECLYGTFKKTIAKKAGALHIRVKEVPFFYPTNSKAIYEQLSADEAPVLQEVYEGFSFSGN
jgi:hypothetical protein